ncbi:choline/ethanolamine kinase [Penaeus vannamei]|uniref:choline/ethanolamine kinase n=1 Tax=Penaeus vannamei TaxID=6689 RepID=UPI000F67BDD4|nr:choline/ethanolamine kinase-like [Penaeus vannamei]
MAAADDSNLGVTDEAEFIDAEITCEMRDRAYRICRDYLHGAWKLIAPPDMILKQISGGLSNLLYYCALPPSHPPQGPEPSEVLLRIYGQVHGEDGLESVLAESVIFALLSERRLGPRLYGVFPGGRLEQYIPARSLFTSELADPNLSAIISTKMARVHALNVPISKEPSWIWNTMDKWLKSSQDFLNNRSLSDREDAQKIAKLQLFNFQKEMEFLRKVVGKVQSPVVFAHNDMQEGNILLNTHAKTRDDQVCLIDFEYCSYNYRGFDVANHFCEWVYEYKLPVDPYFTVARENYPGKDKQLFFIRSYLEAYEAARRRKVVQPTNAIEDSHPISSVSVLSQNNRMMSNMAAPPHPAEDKLLAEVQVFTLVSHLFWTLWSIVQSQVSTIPFGYTDYAIVRMEHYLEDKANLNVDIINKRKSEAMCEDE